MLQQGEDFLFEEVAPNEPVVRGVGLIEAGAVVENILSTVEHLLQTLGVGLEIVGTWMHFIEDGLQPLPLSAPIIERNRAVLLGTGHEQLDETA